MIILGLGSNMGDRMELLRRALALISAEREIQIEQISPVYHSQALLPEDNAPLHWQNMPFLNAAIRCQSTLTPIELLAKVKAIESKLGRDLHAPRFSPRPIDIDILAIDNLQLQTPELTIPHSELSKRPFALWPLNDVAPLWQLEDIHPILASFGSRFEGSAPFKTRQIMQRIDTPKLVGILNITPNSFSDGGQFVDVGDAIAQIKHLVSGGAEIIDIGAEATSPRAHCLTADAEWARLEPLLTELQHIKKTEPNYFLIPPKISIDTYHAETAHKSIALGVDWINDVTGLADPAMQAVLASAKHVDCVMMHHMSIPASGDHIVAREQNPLRVIYDWADERLATLDKAGIARERVIFDPGIGFGKVPEHSLMLIKEAKFFTPLNVRKLYGHSRKLFLGLFTPKKFSERDLETATIALALQRHKVDYLRIHNVKDTAQMLKVHAAVTHSDL